MTIEFDEKGKYYTNVIQKTAIPCIIQTATHQIRGLVHVRKDERLKDELENDERFIAVTDVTVNNSDGSVGFSGPFLAILKTQIVWITPLDDAQTEETHA